MVLALIVLFLILLGVGFYASVHILRILLDYLAETYSVAITVLSPVETIFNVMQLTLLLTLLVAAPLGILFLLNYVRPALYAGERRLLGFVPVSLILGVLGSLFGWFLSFKVFIPYLYNVSTWLPVQNMWTLDNLFGFVALSLFVFFLIFQTPLIIILLYNLGILKLHNIAFVRKVMILLSVVIGAVVTPTPDVVNQLLVAVPFYLLFEASIQYCWLQEKLRSRRAAVIAVPAPKRAVKKAVKKTGKTLSRTRQSRK